MTKQQERAEVVWWRGLRWVEAARMQLWRFEEAFGEEVAALSDARFRYQLSDDNGRSWREALAAGYERYDSQRPLRVPSWALHMQVANELDLLIVALRHVLQAQERIPEHRRPVMGGQDVLRLLRNVVVHFDEVGGKAASDLAEKHPAVEVGAISYTTKEIWIGGQAGVRLSRVKAWLQRVSCVLVDCLAETGIDVPDDLYASRVEGDDELPWPPERLRFHWSIARVDEQDWPQEPPPEEVAKALAMIFAWRRARDAED